MFFDKTVNLLTQLGTRHGFMISFKHFCIYNFYIMVACIWDYKSKFPIPCNIKL